MMLKSQPTNLPVKKLSSAFYHENGYNESTDLFDHYYYRCYCRKDLCARHYVSFTFNNLVFVNKVLLYIMTMTTSSNKWFVKTVLVSSTI